MFFFLLLFSMMYDYHLQNTIKQMTIEMEEIFLDVIRGFTLIRFSSYRTYVCMSHEKNYRYIINKKFQTENVYQFLQQLYEHSSEALKSTNMFLFMHKRCIARFLLEFFFVNFNWCILNEFDTNRILHVLVFHLLVSVPQ